MKFSIVLCIQIVIIFFARFLLHSCRREQLPTGSKCLTLYIRYSLPHHSWDLFVFLCLFRGILKLGTRELAITWFGQRLHVLINLLIPWFGPTTRSIKHPSGVTYVRHSPGIYFGDMYILTSTSNPHNYRSLCWDSSCIIMYCSTPSLWYC
jgi:hypothetical protein